VPKDALQTLLDTWTETALICFPADYCMKAYRRPRRGAAGRHHIAKLPDLLHVIRQAQKYHGLRV